MNDELAAAHLLAVQIARHELALIAEWRHDHPYATMSKRDRETLESAHSQLVKVARAEELRQIRRTKDRQLQLARKDQDRAAAGEKSQKHYTTRELFRLHALAVEDELIKRGALNAKSASRPREKAGKKARGS